ncbi:MAG: tetratricopeptide repeat protein, partial [Patescibacteria group bacterium]|nr:tetratricopeptide repeat protein [Patescibacteria group bacterium]
ADLIYEHRTYLPMVGLVIAFSGLAYNFYNRYNRYKGYIAGAVVVWLLLLSAATLRRAYVWGNEVRLWADIYEKAPNKPRANKNYGVVLAAAGKYEEGVKRLARAVELEPDNADYWSNFGTAYLRWGKYEDSAGKFLKAYELFIAQHPAISPDSFDSSRLLQVPLSSSNSPKDLRQAAQYMNDYGVSMVQLQKGDEALAGFEKALKIDPSLYAAWLGLGASYNIKGDSEMAIKVFSQTVKDFPDQPDGYNNLAIVLKKVGRVEEAAAVLARMPKK